MKYMPVPLPYYACAFCLCAALVLTIAACGCTQPQATAAKTSSGVSVTKPDNSHITVAFTGAPGMDKLLELEITITDDQGKSRTQSIGSRLTTTPVQIRSTQTFTGSYSGNDHVFVTGYFSDGSQRVVFDQDI